MNKITEVSLIDGTYSPEDAREILLSLYSGKIQFHEMKNFSSRERFGVEDANSVKRIPELLESKVVIAGLLEEVSTMPVKIRITSSVQIEVTAELPNESSQHNSLLVHTKIKKKK